eukprot:6468534-Amphidinium_carterae.1
MQKKLGLEMLDRTTWQENTSNCSMFTRGCVMPNRWQLAQHQQKVARLIGEISEETAQTKWDYECLDEATQQMQKKATTIGTKPSRAKQAWMPPSWMTALMDVGTLRLRNICGLRRNQGNSRNANMGKAQWWALWV